MIRQQKIANHEDIYKYFSKRLQLQTEENVEFNRVRMI
jgi:hypothetical protein